LHRIENTGNVGERRVVALQRRDILQDARAG
jgi:hypothetical protein